MCEHLVWKVCENVGVIEVWNVHLMVGLWCVVLLPEDQHTKSVMDWIMTVMVVLTSDWTLCCMQTLIMMAMVIHRVLYMDVIHI